jgi:hypothetical protein
MSLELNERERAFLYDLLVQARGNLREEIYKTEDRAFKESLKEDERTLEGLLARLGPPARA